MLSRRHFLISLAAAAASAALAWGGPSAAYEADDDTVVITDHADLAVITAYGQPILPPLTPLGYPFIRHRWIGSRVRAAAAMERSRMQREEGTIRTVTDYGTGRCETLVLVTTVRGREWLAVASGPGSCLGLSGQTNQGE